jgi:hypothetical protein
MEGRNVKIARKLFLIAPEKYTRLSLNKDLTRENFFDIATLL